MWKLDRKRKVKETKKVVENNKGDGTSSSSNNSSSNFSNSGSTSHSGFLSGEILMRLDPGSAPIAQEDVEWLLPFLFSFGTCLFAVIYTFTIRPITSMLFSTYGFRNQIRGYFVVLFEDMLSQMFNYSLTLSVKEEGVIVPDENCIVICNHQSLLDNFVLNKVALDTGLDASCFFYEYKHCARLFSVRGLINMMLRKHNWHVPEELLPDTFSEVLESPVRGYGGKWVVIYPEAQTMTLTDLHTQRMQCIREGCKPMLNLLYPRFNSFYDTLEFLRECDFTCVLNVTIAYYNVKDPTKPYKGIPTYSDILFSIKEWEIHVFIYRIPMLKIPTREKRVTKWLEKKWYAKDAFTSKLK